MNFSEWLNSPDSPTKQYQTSVLNKAGYEQRTDQETGNTNWVNNGPEGAKKVDDATVGSVFDSAFDPTSGTAGYVRNTTVQPSVVGNANDPTLGQQYQQEASKPEYDAFKDQVQLNGKNYVRTQADASVLNSKSQFGDMLNKAGVTPQDFSRDDKYGNLIEDNPRTQAALKEFANRDPNSALKWWLTGASLMAAPVAGAIAAEGAAANAAGSSAAAAGGGAAGAAGAGAAGGAAGSNILGNPFVRAGSSIISSILNSGGSSGGSAAQGATQGAQPQGLISDFSGLNLGIKPSGNPLTDQAGKPIFGNGIISNVRRG